MSQQTFQPKANQMIRNGCTTGMLFQYLEKQGLREHEIAAVIKTAVRVNKNRQRWIGFSIFLAGITIIGMSAVAWLYLNQMGVRLAKVAGVVAMVGLIISVGGVVRMLSIGEEE